MLPVWIEGKEYEGQNEAGRLIPYHLLEIFESPTLKVAAKILVHLYDEHYCPLPEPQYSARVILSTDVIYCGAFSSLEKAKREAEQVINNFFLEQQKAYDIWEQYRCAKLLKDNDNA